MVVATTSQTPVLFGDWLSPGTHVNAVGAPRPTWRELDDNVLRKARIYVEDGYARPRMREISEVSEAVRGLRSYRLYRVCFPPEVKEEVYTLYHGTEAVNTQHSAVS